MFEISATGVPLNKEQLLLLLNNGLNPKMPFPVQIGAMELFTVMATNKS